MDKLHKLKPALKRAALQLMEKSKSAGISIAITQGHRTIAEQDRLFAKGRSKPGKIVTNAKGGDSFHNYGAAFDFCIMKGNKPDWNDLAQYKKVGQVGLSLGLEWGGSWKKFRDYTHFQYTAGYSIQDFKRKKIDESKFK